MIVQVKGGGVKRGDVATLPGDVNNQKAAGGILLTLEKPTKPMRDEAVDAPPQVNPNAKAQREGNSDESRAGEARLI